MQDYKNNKILELIREIVKVPNQTDYEINGIDTSRAIYFYRKEKEKFKIIPLGSYTIVDEASNKYLRITDSSLLGEALEFQICYLFIKTSSSYVDEFPEIVLLQEHYNQLYDDFNNLLNQLKSNNILGDTLKMSYVLPQLNEGQVWVLRQGEMKAENIFDLDERLEEVFEQFKILFSNWVEEVEKPRFESFVDEKIQIANDELDSKTEIEKIELEDYTEQKKNELDIYLTGRKPIQYATIAELQSSTNLKIGDYVEVAGYYTVGDGANHKRIISDSDDGSGVQLANGLRANIVHNGEVNVLWFGAKGDGFVDDTVYIQKACNFSKSINFSSKFFMLKSTVTVREGTYINGAGANIKSLNNTNFKLNGGCIVENIIFKNTNKTGVALDLSNTLNNVINNVQIFGYEKGILLANCVGDHRGNQINNVFVNGCLVGYYVNNRAEYTTFTNCTATQNDVAVKIIGGNTHFVGGNVCDNRVGFEVLRGDNDAHGFVVGTSIKHNTEYAIYVENPSVGEFFFDSISLYYGNIYLKNCSGIYFRNSTIDTCTVTEENATDCEFRNINYFNKELNNVPNANGTTSYVRYIDVRSAKYITGPTNIRGGYLQMKLVSNIPFSDTYKKISYDTLDFNSINRNVGFRKIMFYDNTDNCIDLTRQIDEGYVAKVKCFFTICGKKIDVNFSDFDFIDVQLKTFYIREGKKIYDEYLFFSKINFIELEEYNCCVYQLNGLIPKGHKIEFFVSNPKAKNIFVARDQVTEEKLPEIDLNTNLKIYNI